MLILYFLRCFWEFYFIPPVVWESFNYSFLEVIDRSLFLSQTKYELDIVIVLPLTLQCLPLTLRIKWKFLTTASNISVICLSILQLNGHPLAHLYRHTMPVPTLDLSYVAVPSACCNVSPTLCISSIIQFWV